MVNYVNYDEVDYVLGPLDYVLFEDVYVNVSYLTGVIFYFGTCVFCFFDGSTGDFGYFSVLFHGDFGVYLYRCTASFGLSLGTMWGSLLQVLLF